MSDTMSDDVGEPPDPVSPDSVPDRSGRPDGDGAHGDGAHGDRAHPEPADEVHSPAHAVEGDVDGADTEDKWPIGFILTISLVGIYLGYRLIQGLVLLVQWVF